MQMNSQFSAKISHTVCFFPEILTDRYLFFAYNFYLFLRFPKPDCFRFLQSWIKIIDMKKRYGKRTAALIIGSVMILSGILLLIISPARTVQIAVNGELRTVTTRQSRVSDILRESGIVWTTSDRIRPGLQERVKSGQRITLERAANIRLNPGSGLGTLNFISHQRFGGNILLDAGLRLYPGDRLFWKDTELRPDFNLGGISEIELRLQSADTFTLISEDAPEGKSAHGSGQTIYDALISAGIPVNKSMMVIPDGDSPFTPGMTIEVLPLHDLTISFNGSLISTVSAGVTIGDALVRAGLPLTGSDVSIPAAGEPLPADGRILIVPVSESFTMKAESIRRETEWTPNPELELDETKITAEGSDGLRGTFSRTRRENGEIVLNETSPETILVSPVSTQAEYGTKISVRTLDTPDGPIEYYRAVKVYATSYSPCRSGTASCITGTASGMKVQKGVAAVTASWYNQFGGQSVYVPDYGKAVIGDVGGGMPGRFWIDLGYEDDNFEGWSRETMLYFLTPVPTDMVWVLQ